MRNKKYLIITIVLILIVSLSALLVACKDTDNGDTETTNYSDTLVSNGNFDTASGDYPMTPSNWTAAPGSSSTSASLKTPNSSDDLVAGVIDVNDERNYRRQFGSIQPGKVGKDDNILAIYNKKATAYKYTSSSISIEADSVYKLSVWCKTDLYDSESDAYQTWKSNNGTVSKEFTGAYINVTGVAFASFQGIDTQGQWQEFVLYINSNNASTGTISISLGLGDGNWESGHMTAGYAFFDYVTLIKLNSEYRNSDSAYVNGNDSLSKDEANEKANADYINAVQGTSDSKFIGKEEQNESHKVHTAKYNSALGDTQFDYVTTTSQPYTASNWSGKAGTKPDGSTHSTSSTYLQRGVLDVKYMDQSIVNDASSYAGFILDAPNAEDASVVYDYNSGYSRTNSNVLYINNRRSNVYSYRSSVAYKVEAGDYYKLKVYVKTYGNNAAASVKLTYGSDYVALASVNGIKTDGEWQAVELYVKGDMFRDRTLSVELWLGENNTDGCIGIAMFDCVSWEEVDASAYNAANSDIKGEFANENDIEYKEIGNSDSSAIDYVVDADNTYDSSFAKLLKNGDTYNDTKIDIALSESNKQGVWVIDNTIPTRTAIMPNIDIASTADTSNLIKVDSNTYIILSAWVKTSEIKSGGLSVALYEYDIEALNKAIADGKVTQANKGNLSDYKTSMASLTSLTSKSLESYIKDTHNGYAMISFAIEGTTFKDSYVGLEFSLGSGSNANSTSYVSGNAMITNLMIEKSNAATHSSTSSATNIATASLKSGGSSNEFASNGYFSVVDASNTNSTYQDVIKDNDLGDFEYADDNEWHVLPLPKSWSASSTTRLTDKFDAANSYAYGGTLNLNSATQRKWFTDEIGGVSSYLTNALADNAYTSIYETAGQLSGLTLKDNPTVLALYANRLNKFGMSSSSVSLSANSYYVISAWVFADRNTRVSVSLTTGTDNAQFGFIDVTNSANGWQQYRIFIETGVTSINATLSLTLGSVNADDQVSNNSYAALFTGATYQAITEDDYNSFVSNSKSNGTSVSWLVDSMDNVNESEDNLASNEGWSGSLIDSDASTDDVDAGVFDRNIHSWDTLLDLDVDGEDRALLEAVFNASVNDSNINNGTLTAIGNRVMVIYNHDDVVDDDGNLNGGAYKMTSNSITLTKGSYYKLSVWVLTYKIGKDNSAIVSLSIGNNSYTFGNAVGDDNSELDNLRRINTSTYSDDGTETVGTWRELSFYVYIEEEVTDTVTASLTLQLGDDDEWVSGYAFFDNFSCVKVAAPENSTEVSVIAGKLGFTPTETTDDEKEIFSDKNGYTDGKPSSVLGSNYIIRYTQADAEKEPEETPTDEGTGTNRYLWAYITSGVIGGLIVIVVVLFLLKKFMAKHKRSKQVNRKSSYDRSRTSDSDRKKYSDK